MSRKALAAVVRRIICFGTPLLITASVFAAQSVGSLSTVATSGDSVQAIVSQGNDLGRVAPDTEMKVTVWLKQSNARAFDQAVEQIYTPGSPTYHHWMTDAEIAQYGVLPQDVESVRTELEAHGLTVTPVENGLGLVARGTVGNIEAAFGTELRNYAVKGRTLRANATSAALQGPAANVVSAISGLTSSTVKPMMVRQTDSQGQPRMWKAITPAASGLSGFITNQCFQTPTAFTFTTPNAPLPFAVYFGNIYDQGPSRSCGYEPEQLRRVYGLDAAYKLGLQGDGQTIVIVDAFGSPTITADANLFSAIEGLPFLTSANFQIVYPSGMPTVDFTSSNQQGWAGEVALDVEWAHAMAPNAKIVLVAALSDSDQDIQAALHYATAHHLGDVVSNSYSGAEQLSTVSDVRAYNTLIKRAAAQGMALNFASGDDGDLVIAVKTVAVPTPGDSPYATSVGGTSLNIPSNNGPVTTGWGNNISLLTGPSGPYDPPVVFDQTVHAGFKFGSGGGESSVFNKPAYQKGLPGSGRQQPDVSAIADPFTGVPVIFTQFSDMQQYVLVAGGTSLATPVFSAIWSLADQLAGKSLGQAAPIVAQLSDNAILDVVPVTSATNVFGAIVDSTGYTQYKPTDLVVPLPQPKFVSAFIPLYNSGVTPSSYDLVSFGTDSSLRIAKGWDNVTGYGTPAGLAFIKEAATYK